MFVKKLVHFPSETVVNNFLKDKMAVNVTKINSVSYSMIKKCVNILFQCEKEVFDFENKINVGIKFPGTDCYVEGYRLDRRHATARLTGAPHLVE